MAPLTCARSFPPAASCPEQLLESTNARAVLSPEEELVLLIAAICHDLDHDGYTNSFHIYSQSALAQQYNDKSGECVISWVACIIQNPGVEAGS